MIYCQKAFELLDRVGWEEADTVLGPLVPNMTLSTRYDRLPYMTKFLRAWRESELDLRAVTGANTGIPFDSGRYELALLEGGPADAFSAVRDALEAGVAVPALINATSRAAAERLNRFDIELDTDDTNEWGWLDVTHTLTYIAALRWAWSVDPSLEVLRGLLHAAWFIQWTQQLDAPQRTAVPAREGDTDDVLAAIRSRDPEAAVATITGYNGPVEGLHRALGQAAAEDNTVAPIMIAHTVKTSRASMVESAALGGDKAPITAVGRFLASPKRERFVYRATLEALDFVAGRSKGEDQ